MAGTQPFGYKRIKLSKQEMQQKDKNNIEKVDSKIKVIEALYGDYLKENPSWLQNQNWGVICKKLRKNTLLQNFSNHQLWKMLTQSLYKGYMVQTLGGHVIEALTPQYSIIDENKWNNVQEILNGMKKKPPFMEEDTDEERHEISLPLLKGLLFCGVCKKEMENSKKVYQCKDCKQKPQIDKLNKEVYQQVLIDLLKKAIQELDTLKVTIIKIITKPVTDLIEKKAKEIEGLRIKIKFDLQKHLLNKTIDTEQCLKDTIESYLKATDEWNRATKQQIRMNHFVQGLSIREFEILENLKEYLKMDEEIRKRKKSRKESETVKDVLNKLLELNGYQIDQLLTLVKKVTYRGRTRDMRLFYTEGSGL